MFEAFSPEEKQQYNDLVDAISDSLCHGVTEIDVNPEANPLVVSHVVREFQKENWGVESSGNKLIFRPNLPKSTDNKPADMIGIRSVSQP